MQMVYVTVPDKGTAKDIAQSLLKKKLIACANIFPEITSLYVWDGKQEEAAEVVMVLKTRDALVEQAIEAVKALHPYACPCVVALAITKGNTEFLKWLENSTELPYS